MIGRAAVFASVSLLLVACNGLTGVGDLHVMGDGGAGGSESRGAGNPGNGGASGVGGVATSAHGPATNGAGPATNGAGPSTTTGAGPSTSAAGPATTTGAGPATTTGAGPSTTTGAGPATSAASSVAATTGTGGMDPAQMCVDFINQKRATIGLGPLARSSSDETCVSGQAHTDANNMTAHSAFGTCSEFAQNECPGWPGPPSSMIDNCLQMMWDEGPGSDYSTHGHYINMTNTSYTKVACGFYVLGDGSVWAAQDFWP